MDHDNKIDLAAECAKARRYMRTLLLKYDDPVLKSAYYEALLLSEHEAARRIIVELT